MLGCLWLELFAICGLFQSCSVVSCDTDAGMRICSFSLLPEMDQEGFYPLLMSCLFNFSPVISTQQPLPFCQLAHRGGDGWHRKVSLAVLTAPRNGNLQHGEAMCVAEGMGNSHSSCLGATRMPWLCGWALNSVFAAAQLNWHSSTALPQLCPYGLCC